MMFNTEMSWPYMRMCVLFCLTVSTAALPLWSYRSGETGQWIDVLRELKTQRLHAARALEILKDHPAVISSISDQPATVASITLSLIESVKLAASSMNANLTVLSVIDSESDPVHSESRDKSPHTLRVEFSTVLARAIDLLALFDAVREAADWRPIEVRGCSLTRGDQQSGLVAICTIDVYYYPEVDS